MIISPQKILVDLVALYVQNHLMDRDDFKDRLARLRDIYLSQRNNGIYIDYDVFALPSLWLYYFANYAKTKLACTQLFTTEWPYFLKVLDLGCGSGASTVGFLDYIIEFVGISKIQSIDIDIVDISKKQLEIFDYISRNYIHKKYSEIIKFNRYCTDICIFLEPQRNAEKYDIVIASNLLSEIYEAGRTEMVKKIKSVLSSGGVLLVIEREETEILRFIRDVQDWSNYKINISGPHTISGLEPLEAVFTGFPIKKYFELCSGVFQKNKR